MKCKDCIKCALGPSHNRIEPLIIHDIAAMQMVPTQDYSIPHFSITIQCMGHTSSDYMHKLIMMPSIDHEGNAAAMIKSADGYQNIISLVDFELFFKAYCDKINVSHLKEVFEVCSRYHG
jgi:hypothetical protein